MNTKPAEVILLRETPLQSWKSDMSSVVGFVLLIGIGVYLESNAMQWVGAILGFFTIMFKAIRHTKDNRFTVAQARKRLDEIEASMREENA